MKKGFTMIELIFVIVILGILASVAIPRLAATREDAEISTTIANLRTLISEASSYYVGHGIFNTTAGAGVPWSDVTNVPLRNKDNTDAAALLVTAAASGDTGAYLVAGKKPCIGVQLVSKAGSAAAHIKLTQHSTNSSSGVCQQVLGLQAVRDYFNSTITNVTPNITNAIPVSSSKGVYAPAS